MSSEVFYLSVNGRKVRVSEEVYHECRRSEDRERYFMETLKRGRIVVNQDEMSIEYIPGREVSYESLVEAEREFPAPDMPVDEMLVKAQLMEKLEEALHILTREEMELIQELFYLERTEREAADMLRVSPGIVHYRKNKVLGKLKRMLKKFL